MKQNKHNRMQEYKWLRKNLVGHKFSIFILAVLNCIISICLLAFAFFSKEVLDIATNEKQGSFWVSGSILLVIIVIQVLLILLNINLRNDIVIKCNNTVKNNLMRAIINTDYEKIMSFHTGELLNRLSSDVSIVVTNYINLIVQISAFVSRLIIGITALIIMSKTFTLIFLLIMCVLFFLGRIYGRYVKKLHKITQKTEGEIKSCLTESLDNLSLVKSFTANDLVMDNLIDKENKNLHARRKKILFASISSSALYFIFTASYYVALIYGAICIANGSMTFGSLTAFLLIINQIQTPLKSMSGLVQQFYEILSSAQRLMEVIDLDKENSLIQPSDFDKLVVKDMTFSYDKVIFDNFNMEIYKGEIIGIKGESGRGKTSLINLLLGFYKPQQGEIYLSCGDDKQPISAGTRSYFSLCPQGNQILSGSIYENIVFNNEPHDMDKILQICCLDELVNSLPDGLNTYIGERGYGLSEGQIQRICLARAIMANKPIILLDEFTSALDSETENKILNNIKQLDKTMIMISHKDNVFSICDKVIYV